MQYKAQYTQAIAYSTCKSDGDALAVPFMLVLLAGCTKTLAVPKLDFLLQHHSHFHKADAKPTPINSRTVDTDPFSRVGAIAKVAIG